MFKNFTEGSLKAIALAQEEARLLGHNSVGTLQLLLGLLGERQGVASMALRSCGVTLNSARNEVEKIIGRGNGPVEIEISLTPRAKEVLELSWDQASQLRDRFVGTEHLLMSLISKGHDVEVQVLRGLHVDLQELHAQIEYLRKESADTPGASLRNWLPAPIFLLETVPEILSSSAVELLKSAQSCARQTGHRLIGSEHILLAILGTPSSIGARTLLEHGVTLDAARTKANEIAHEGLGDLGQSLRNTPRAERIMAIAHREAHELRDIETNIEHILLAILQENRGIGRQVLNELAVKCDKLKTDLLANMRTKAKE